MRLKRKPHQVLAVSDMVAGFKHSDRGQFISACGTGKSLSTLWLKEDMDAQRVVVFVPSLALLDQFASQWRANMAPHLPYETLCVCSDSTVGYNSEAQYDDIEFTREDLEKDGFNVTSDPAAVADFVKKDVRQVIFSTYHSSHIIAEAQRRADVPEFNLAIADEAHRTASAYGSTFSLVLRNDLVRAKKRLFATATPRIYRSQKNSDGESQAVMDMNNEKVYGPRFHTLSLPDAIEQGLLADYRIVVMVVRDKDIHELLNSSAGGNLNTLGAQVGLLRTIEDFGLKNIITFHSRVSAAADFAKKLPNIASILKSGSPASQSLNTDHLSGTMPAALRKKALQAMRQSSEGVRVISNARCLTEGVDVPNVDGVAFIDPKGSALDIIQGIGRAIRLSQDKQFGTIMVPLFLEEGDRIENVIKTSKFKPIIDVLTALKASDSRFESDLNLSRQIAGTNPGAEAEFNPFQKITFHGIGGVENAKVFARSIQPSLIDSLTDRWEEWYGILIACKSKYGHCNIPALMTWPEGDPNGVGIGYWLSNQRAAFKAGKLSSDQQKKLELIGVVWDVLTNEWENNYNLLLAYKNKYGHCNVPYSLTWPENDPDGVKLGVWLGEQRKDSKSGRIVKERLDKLESLGFIWSVKSFEWDTKFNCLVEFKNKYGHCNIPYNQTWPENDPDGVKIGVWIRNIRKDRNFSKTSPDKIDKLKSLGVVFGLTIESARNDEWDRKFGYVIEYKNKYGHCNIPYSAIWPEGDPIGVKIGHWLSKQKRALTSGDLTESQKEKLESLNLSFDVFGDEWDKNYRCLVAYKNKYGNCTVPRRTTWPENDTNGVQLGNWAKGQRVLYNSGKLSLERQRKLESLGMAWDVPSDEWDKKYASLIEYKNKYGDCNVPQRFTWPEGDPNGFTIGRWVSSQREVYRKGKMSPSRKEKLESLGFVWVLPNPIKMKM